MLVSKSEAATMIGVPQAWIDVMIEIGGIEAYRDDAGNILIDAEEIEQKGYISPQMKAQSLSHVESILKKLTGKS